jgi:dTDP-4-amino-4,6-dideoxygalactose transaminase
MSVPMVNLRPLLEATASEWRAYLEQLFVSMNFILGQQVDSFEKELATHFGSRFAVAVGSGTAAIELGLRAARLRSPRGEVITSTLTSPFTALAILHAGCRPRFADVDPERLLLDTDDVAARITRRTVAVVPVHLYGQPCDLPGLAALCRTNGIVMVQDACQAHGASFRNRPFTGFSSAVAYSFYPTKNLGCLGDGGAIVTNHAWIAARVRMLRDGGRRNNQISRFPGLNSRLHEMQACYLRAFLPHLDEWNSHRARIAAIYDEVLSGCDAIRPVRRGPDTVNHLYVIRVARRERLRYRLAQCGITTGVHYPVPLHLQPVFRDCGSRRGDLPCAEKACREVVSLPLWPYMPETDARRVAEIIRSFFR